LAALDALDPYGCLYGHSTPLADAICEAAEDYPSGDYTKIMSLLTDGGEYSSSGQCSGEWSQTGPPPSGNYDTGSWQLKSWQKCQDENVTVNVWFWDDFGKSATGGDDGKGGGQAKSGITDEVFFQDLCDSTGGGLNGEQLYVYEEPKVPGPTLLLIPVALLLCGLASRHLWGRL
jgi:hypothetical protein